MLSTCFESNPRSAERKQNVEEHDHRISASDEDLFHWCIDFFSAKSSWLVLRPFRCGVDRDLHSTDLRQQRYSDRLQWRLVLILCVSVTGWRGPSPVPLSRITHLYRRWGTVLRLSTRRRRLCWNGDGAVSRDTARGPGGVFHGRSRLGLESHRYIVLLGQRHGTRTV